MEDRSESVHVHKSDASLVVREYRQKGYVLKERAKPTIAAQDGFIRLIFIPEEEAPCEKPSHKLSPRSLWQLLLAQLSPRS